MLTANHVEDTAEPICFSGRFVILTHDTPQLHWDLMLEADGTLRTWRLLSEPEADTIIAAEPLPDHRLHYLDYEGPVSKGRGTVARWDNGLHRTIQTSQRTLTRIESQRLGTGRIIISPESLGEPWTFYFQRTV